MLIQPYLTFDGNCEEAFDFYARALGGTIAATHRFRDMPPPEGNEGAGMDSDALKAVGDKIMHTRLEVGDQVLMGSDRHPSFPYNGVHGFSVTLAFEDPAEGKKVFEALAEGATVSMPYGPTFWSEGFGMLNDRFGVPWMVNAGAKSPP